MWIYVSTYRNKQVYWMIDITVLTKKLTWETILINEMYNQKLFWNMDTFIDHYNQSLSYISKGQNWLLSQNMLWNICWLHPTSNLLGYHTWTCVAFVDCTTLKTRTTLIRTTISITLWFKCTIDLIQATVEVYTGLKNPQFKSW